MEGTWKAFKSGFVTGAITGIAGPLANAFKITSLVGKITLTVTIDVVGAYAGMRVVNDKFTLKDFLIQGGISLLVNVITHKDFMPNLKTNLKGKFNFKADVEIPEGQTTPHGGPEVPGVHPDDPNVSGIKPDDKVPLKDVGDGQKVGLDEQGGPIVCASPCNPLDKKFGNLIHNMEEPDKSKYLKELDDLDKMPAGTDKVNKTQELAAELNNIKNGKNIPKQGAKYLPDPKSTKVGGIMGDGKISYKDSDLAQSVLDMIKSLAPYFSAVFGMKLGKIIVKLILKNQ